jgi:hypothetical protein
MAVRLTPLLTQIEEAEEEDEDVVDEEAEVAELFTLLP